MAWWTRERPDEAAAFIATVPQGRVGSCEHDIGRFVVSLCSDDSRYITGQSIGVDGGQAFLGETRSGRNTPCAPAPLSRPRRALPRQKCLPAALPPTLRPRPPCPHRAASTTRASP